MTHTPRLTIAALIGLVALCAVTLAALRTSSPYLASAMMSLTVFVLLCSVVAAIWGRHRALWSGFAIFGWGYFVLAFCSPFRDVVRPHMISSIAIIESYHRIHPEVTLELMDLAFLPAAGASVGPVRQAQHIPNMPAPQFVTIAGEGPAPVISAAGYYVPVGPNRFYTFECSAHAAFTLAAAGFGGVFATLVAHRAAANSRDTPNLSPRDDLSTGANS